MPIEQNKVFDLMYDKNGKALVKGLFTPKISSVKYGSELKSWLEEKANWYEYLPDETLSYRVHRNEYSRVCKELGGDVYPWLNLGNEMVLLTTGNALTGSPETATATGGEVKQANGFGPHKAESQYLKLGYVRACLKCAFSELEQLAIDGLVQWAVYLDDEEILRTHQFSRKSFKTYQGLPQE